MDGIGHSLSASVAHLSCRHARVIPRTVCRRRRAVCDRDHLFVVPRGNRAKRRPIGGGGTLSDSPWYRSPGFTNFQNQSITRSMADSSVFELLRLAPVFADIPVVALQAVAARSQAILKKKGTRVFEEDSPADCCFVLTSGRAKVVIRGSRDSEVILGIIEPYSIIGEIALLDGSARSAGLVTVEKSHF